MIIQVQLKGLESLMNNFREFPVIFIKNVNDSIKQSIFKVERETKPRTPVDTGRLRASIGGGGYTGGSYPSGVGREFRNLYGSIGTDVKYAIYVHEGTYRMKGRPFLKEGVEISLPEIQRYFEMGITKTLNNLAK